MNVFPESAHGVVTGQATGCPARLLALTLGVPTDGTVAAHMQRDGDRCRRRFGRRRWSTRMTVRPDVVIERLAPGVRLVLRRDDADPTRLVLSGRGVEIGRRSWWRGLRVDVVVDPDRTNVAVSLGRNSRLGYRVVTR